jgi:GNAT superfamily N-acetyltransferase
MKAQPVKRQLQRPRPSATAAPKLVAVDGRALEPSIQVESLYDVASELPPLFVRYGREFDKPSDPDWTSLLRMTAAGQLKLVTVRDNGLLVGFAFTTISPHLMFKSVMYGFTHAVWLDPAYRSGWLPVKFLRFNLERLKELGCQRVSIGRNVHWPRLDKVYRRLGYELEELLYVRTL